MGQVVMCRVDARLVHGQVAARWTKYLDAQKIIIIDDDVAKDDFMIELFDLAAPMGSTVLCYSVEKAVNSWKENQFGEGKIITLFKTIEYAKKAQEEGYNFEKLNIGQVPGGEGRQHAVETVSLSPNEVDELLEIEKKGANVYFQSLPDVNPTPLSSVAKKFNK